MFSQATNEPLERLRDVVRAIRERWLNWKLRRLGPKDVDWSRVSQWVFVCQGNLCRSPFAEVWCRNKGLMSASCGINGVLDKPADSDAVRVAREFGVDLSGHRGLNVRDFRFGVNDLVICFEERQAKSVAPMANGAQLLLLGQCLHPPRSKIDDPFAGSDERFRASFANIVEGLQSVVQLVSKAR